MPSNDNNHIRVCHVHLGSDWGGAEMFLVRLARGLTKRGIKQKVVMLKGKRWTPLLREAGCEVIEMNFPRGFMGLFSNMRLRREVKNFKPTAVMAWMSRAARRMPKGAWVSIGRLGGYYPIKHYDKCDYLVGNTPDLVDYFAKENWPAEKSVMISNYSDLQPTAPVDRATYNTPNDKPLLVAIGRLVTMKAFDVLLRSVALLPDTYLWIISDGELRQQLQDYAIELGIQERVKFLGVQPNPAPHIAACDVFVVPSRHEPLGNVVLDAWAMGKPVVAAASEGPRWLIEDGVSGLLAPIEDHEALATAIKRVIDDKALAEKLIAGGTAKMQESFCEEVICNQFIELFLKKS